MTAPRSSRRRVLTGLLGLGAWVVGLPRAQATVATVGSHDPMVSSLRALLRHADSAVTVGEAYRRVAPEECAGDRLVELIEARCGGRAFEGDRQTVRHRLSHAIHQDFVDAHVVRVQGWVLSVTEARLCALAAIVLGPAGRRPATGRRR
jgi:hypothetical protein